MDAGESALRILLMNHVMDKKHIDLEKKYKDVAEDVEKWKHKATGLQSRLLKLWRLRRWLRRLRKI